MSDLDPLRKAARRDPDAPALDDGERVWSYRELDRAADLVAARAAAALERVETHGGGPGASEPPVAMLQAAPGAPGVAAIHGLPRAGCVVAPVSPRWTSDEVAEVGAQLAPTIVLSHGPPPESLAELVSEGGLIRMDQLSPAGSYEDASSAESFPPAGDPGPGEPSSPGVSLPDILAILWTSGTSGERRGVSLWRLGMITHAKAVAQRLELGPGDSWYAVLDLAHVGGLSLVFRSAVLGSRLVVRRRFSAGDLVELFRDGTVTHAAMVPVMLRRLVEAEGGDEAPEGARCLLIGGAPAPRPLLERALRGRWPVALTYGMTEASSQVTTAPPELVRRKPGTVGSPLDGIEVRIAAPQDGSDPSLARYGEIHVRSPALARDVADANGWYHTGDLGRFDADGHLWVTGRVSDRIISGGVTVAPGEVEAVLRSHPGVDAAAVVALDDPEWGQRPGALVVASDASESGLHEMCRRRLSPAKRPRVIRLVRKLPRTPIGKVDRGAVRRLLEEAE